MKKQKLPIDLITVNTNRVQDGINALNFSSKEIEFNNILLLSNEDVYGNFNLVKKKKLNNVEDYNKIILSLNNYISSDFALVIQHDGHVINPSKWSKNFLNYDYIGAPWPNNKKWNKRWDSYEEGDIIKKNLNKNRIGNGGFSLRSKKFLEYSTKFNEIDLPEDIFLNLYNYDIAVENNILYPDISTAIQFSYETPLSSRSNEKDVKFRFLNKKKHFGWHGERFLNSNKLINLKNN